MHFSTYSVKQFSTSSAFQEQILFFPFSSLSIKSNNVDILKHSMNTNLSYKQKELVKILQFDPSFMSDFHATNLLSDVVIAISSFL